MTRSTTDQGICLRGIVPPLVTPLAARDKLDVEGLEKLIEHIIAGGVSGVFILGTTGEAPSLSYRLRRELIERTTRAVKGRITVLVGVTDTAFVESVALAQYAEECGADAVVLTTPYYFPAGQTELLAYVQEIAKFIPLPMMLYNMPELTKIWFEVDTVKQLLDIPSIVGLKDSSGDMEYFASICNLKKQRPEWSVLIGPEAKLAAAHQLGGDGGVNGGANVLPRLFVDCYEGLRDNDPEKVNQCMQTITSYQRIYEIGKYASRHIKATKSALSLLGICSDLPADPFHPFYAPERERVAAILQQMGVL